MRGRKALFAGQSALPALGNASGLFQESFHIPTQLKLPGSRASEGVQAVLFSCIGHEGGVVPTRSSANSQGRC